jgi:hypothetical protein
VSVLEAFKFAVTGEGWLVSILVSTVMMFVPIIGPIVTQGYYAEVMQRLARREPVKKFSLNDFSAYLSRGLPTFVVQLVVSFALLFPLMVLVFPVMVVASKAVDPSYAGPLMLGIMATLFSLAFFLLGPIVNAALTYAALSEDIGASLRPGPLFAYAKRTWGIVLVSYVVLGLLSIVAAMVGFLMLFIGVYFAVAITQLALAHLRWQIYEVQLARGGALIPIKAPVALPVYPGAYGYGQQGYGQPYGYNPYAPAPTDRQGPPR